MRRPIGRVGWLGGAVLGAVLAACTGDSVVVVPGEEPAPPQALDGRYYNGAVFLTWELDSGWNQESFRVYGRRAGQSGYLLIAEVTSCQSGLCNYTDRNIAAGQTYTYYVASYDSRSGAETSSDYAVDVAVPSFTPPPVPTGLQAVALDAAVYLRWGSNARSDGDFSFYRVYIEGTQGDLLLGETDSEGFLDLLVENGTTYGYRVSSVDEYGHESSLGQVAAATPRPDYRGEVIYAFEDVPSEAGFRFVEDEATLPIVSGTASNRHFRLEVDAAGWWLVPASGVQVHPQGFATSALVCGPDADRDCVALEQAPNSGYTTQDVGLLPQTTYAIRYAEGGSWRYGAIRVSLQGFDQDGNALMIFDWAHQLQTGNPNLAPAQGVPLIR
jgi:hypothetical protein